MNPTFETARLRAREMTLDDLDFVASMLGDTEVMRYYPWCYSRDESEAWIRRQMENYATHGFGRWLIEEREGGRPVGQIGLLPQRIEGVAVPEVAYMVARPWWRQGIAAEAAGASRDHAFERLGVDRVISLIRPENLPSIAVAGRLGMVAGPSVVHFGLLHVVYSVDRPGTLASGQGGP